MGFYNNVKLNCTCMLRTELCNHCCNKADTKILSVYKSLIHCLVNFWGYHVRVRKYQKSAA